MLEWPELLPAWPLTPFLPLTLADISLTPPPLCATNTNDTHTCTLHTLLTYAYPGVLLTAALGPIYIGSFTSLRTPRSTIELRKKHKKKSKSADATSSSDSEDDDEGVRIGEKVTSEDAWLFPVFGSVVLFSMYLIFRYVDKYYVNLLLSFYFGCLGVLSLTKGLVGFAERVPGARAFKRKLDKIKVDITKAGEELLLVKFTWFDVAFFGVSLVLVAAYILTKHWMLSNLLALSLSLNAITLIELDSFVTGSIVLGGLFLYDIFWVFGTEVMVSVARNFDAPIKIVWPKNFPALLHALLSSSSSAENAWGLKREAISAIRWQFTMLGLGDIVMPGIFVALALRYDQHRAATAKPSIKFTRRFTSFPKPYFTATFIAYIAGLATTMAVMHVFKAAQPALLYLSPACVGAVALQSFLRGEVKDVWSWQDGGDDEEEKEKKEDKKAKKSEGDEKLERRKSSSAEATRRSRRVSASPKKSYAEDLDSDGEKKTLRARRSQRALASSADDDA